jgi:hypothetical protein
MATTFQSASPSSIIHRIPNTFTGLTLPCYTHTHTHRHTHTHTHTHSHMHAHARMHLCVLYMHTLCTCTMLHAQATTYIHTTTKRYENMNMLINM